MCVVSMVGDHYGDIWKEKPWFPDVQPYVRPVPQGPPNGGAGGIMFPTISRHEFDELKRQVAEMKQLLIRAKMYDEQNNEPHCEMDEKMELLRRIAAAVGIDLDDVIKKKSE